MGKGIYIVAVVATIAIFLLIWFFITSSEDSKATQLNDEIRQLSLENELYAAYAGYDSNNKQVYCTILDQSIASLSKRADALELQLSTYKQNAFNSKEFSDTKRNYLMVNMLLLKNFEDAQKYCDFNRKAVLFFYSEDKSCEPDCGVIGTQLFELAKSCSSFRSFNFPFAWPNYEFTKILEVKYGVTKPATIVVDSNKYEGAMKVGALAAILGCS